ncbi:MAG: cytidylate kinase family protein [Deltaproteobacteria bacterium]|nr:cytidylate kinase family protein [Deltaproteobacteria bacterium]
MAIITISRGTFSGGKALAERLAERLGYPCFSREMILADTAKEYGISVTELTSAMHEPPPFWQQVPGKRIAYLKCFTAALLNRGDGGEFVYHGHAGHLLLGGISHVLRIRVIADAEYRIHAAMEQLNTSREEAIAYIEKVDRERNRWMQFLYGLNWGEPTLYDAVLNLERMNIDSVCDVITCFVGLDDFKATAESEKAVKDLTLGTRVWAALAKNEKTKAAFVQVVADNGNVVISGGAGSEKVVDAIPEVARQVAGVGEIRNEVGIGGDWYW